MDWLAGAALALALSAVAAPGMAAEAAAPVRVIGNVEQSDARNPIISAWIAPFNAHFLIDTRNAGQRSKAAALLEQARREDKRIVLAFDPSSGTIDLNDPVPAFRVQELDFGSTRLVLDPTPTGTASPGASGSAARAVVNALGRRYSGDWDGAKDELKGALADVALPPPIRALVYRSLGEMAQTRGEADHQIGAPESDQLLVEALAAFRSEQAEAPDASGPKDEIAWVLFELGAYDEALAIYKDLAANTKSHAFWAPIAISYVHRTLGEYEQSLQTLDNMARSQGSNSMPYHYHRGLTLLKMGRDPEAADEFTAGLRFQPDYSWALMKRACAYGRQGRLEQALADARRASDLRAQMVFEKAFAREAHDQARTAAVIQDLSAAVAAGKPAKIDSACSGFWADGYDRRPRSPLLPKALPDGDATAA